MKALALSLVVLFSASFALAQGRGGPERFPRTETPLILKLKTDNGKSYYTNIGRIDCSYVYPYNHACAQVPDYTGSAVNTATLNGENLELPETGTSAHTGVNSLFDVSSVCVFYAKLYGPLCRGRR